MLDSTIFKIMVLYIEHLFYIKIVLNSIDTGANIVTRLGTFSKPIFLAVYVCIIVVKVIKKNSMCVLHGHGKARGGQGNFGERARLRKLHVDPITPT